MKKCFNFNYRDFKRLKNAIQHDRDLAELIVDVMEDTTRCKIESKDEAINSVSAVIMTYRSQINAKEIDTAKHLENDHDSKIRIKLPEEHDIIWVMSKIL